MKEPMICAIRGRSEGDWNNNKHTQEMELMGGGISHSITSVAKDNYLLEPCILKRERTEEERKRMHIYGDSGAKFQAKQYTPSRDGCSNTITTALKDNLVMNTQPTHDAPEGIGWKWDSEKELWYRERIRKLTPRECFRLMDVSEKDIDKIQNESGVSPSQQYKLAGNSIVVACMYYTFRNLFFGDPNKELTLF